VRRPAAAPQKIGIRESLQRVAIHVPKRHDGPPNGRGPSRHQDFIATPGGLEVERQGFRGFVGPDVVVVPDGRAIVRSPDDLVAETFSMSSTAPHLFGERLSEFERDLRRILAEASPDGAFSVRLPANELKIWRPTGPRARPADSRRLGGGIGLRHTASRRSQWCLTRERLDQTAQHCPAESARRSYETASLFSLVRPAGLG
jgi:hypothetical protein